MKQFCTILFLGLSFFLSQGVKGQLYTVKDYGRKDGLINTSFHTVEESPEGYLWFGSDGAGVVRFDGSEFNYLTQLQGRKNKHVSNILIRKNEMLYSTLYSGVYKVKNDSLLGLEYIQPLGRSHGTFDFEDNLVVLQDGVIKIFKDTVLINEEFLPVFSPLTIFPKVIELKGNLLIFSSVGNYRVKDKKIQSLESWLAIDKDLANQLIGAYVFNDNLVFFDKDLENKVIVVDGRASVLPIKQKEILEKSDAVRCWDFRGQDLVLVTEKGKIFRLNKENQGFDELIYNRPESFSRISDVLIDKNEDIWLTSLYSGIHRVSIEPFTLMSNNEFYRDEYISFYAKLKTGEDIISLNNKTTYLGCDLSGTCYRELKGKSVNYLAYYEDVPIVATRSGVYQISNSKFEVFQPLRDLKGKEVSLVSYDFGYLWYAIAGKGLFRKDVKTGEEVYYQNAPAYFYNVSSHKDSTHLYFGTNGGLYQYSRKTGHLSQDYLSTFNEEYGYYVGNATQDKYGTLWFSFDNALVGITKNKEIAIISSQDYLPSLLIYTLNADRQGNLLVGSNLGITVIEVNESGEALTSMTFDKDNGFNGYETHMRVSYENPEDGSVFVGTAEGLAIIRPEYLNKVRTPNTPIIFSFRDKSVENLLENNKPIEIQSENNNIFIEFISINRKSKGVLYSYRLKGGAEKWTNWSNWSNENSVYFDNLKKGNYVFEVRASLNRFDYSEIASVHFKVGVPFYKTTGAVLLVIGFFLMVNVVILRRSSSLNWSDFMRSRDWDGDMVLSKRLLYVGVIIHCIVHFLASRIDDTLVNHDVSIFVFHLVVLFWVVGHQWVMSRFLKLHLDLGFISLVAYNLVYVFVSAVHPFYFVNVLILSIAVPYVFKRSIGVLIYTLSISAVSAAAILMHQESIYNQYLFVIGISLIGFIVVAINYLQNKTFARLIFTSGVINTGNSPVIAFDEEDNMIFVSENLEHILGVKESLVGKNSSYLEKFYSDSRELDSYRFYNENLKFEDGKTFVSPFVSKDGNVIYYQWTSKAFPNNLKVIIGKDVTEEKNIENNYKQIIKNIDRIILRTDIDGNLLFINDYGSDFFGKKRSELVGSSFFSRVELHNQARVRAFFDDILRGREYDEYIEAPINVNGEVKWTALNLSVFKKSATETTITGFLIVGRELSKNQE